MKDENKDIKSSIIKEALIDYNSIMEAAKITAKDELSLKYKEEFNNFLNEELKKLNNKNNPVETTELNESEMKQNNKIIKEDMNNDNQNVDDVNVDDFPIEEVEETPAEEPDFNFNIDDIEKEIGDLENTQSQEMPAEELPSEENKEIKVYDKLLELQNEINKIIEELKEEDDVDQNQSQDAVPAENKEGEQPNSDGENEVDEIYTLSLSGNKRADSATMPRPEYFPSKENKLRIALRNEMAESFNKKFTSLLNENKKSVKELNLTKKEISKTKNLNEGYKIALEKYRNQLQEMAIFNTNLANANNLFMNEELSLNFEDRVKIINEFKKVKSITESETKYSEMLNEMKQAKKSISETLEEKLSVSIQSSSRNILDEAVDNNKKSSNNSLDKIMKNINYIERKDKK
jgi:hypothetical protein